MAKEAWKALAKHHQKATMCTIASLLQRMYEIRYTEGDDIDEYLTKLKDLQSFLFQLTTVQNLLVIIDQKNTIVYHLHTSQAVFGTLSISISQLSSSKTFVRCDTVCLGFGWNVHHLSVRIEPYCKQILIKYWNMRKLSNMDILNCCIIWFQLQGFSFQLTTIYSLLLILELKNTIVYRLQTSQAVFVTLSISISQLFTTHIC